MQFNPISIYSPFSAIEVGLIAGVDWVIEAKFRQTFISRLLALLAQLGREKDLTPERVAQLQTRLETTKNYQIYLSMKSSWMGWWLGG